MSYSTYVSRNITNEFANKPLTTSSSPKKNGVTCNRNVKIDDKYKQAAEVRRKKSLDSYRASHTASALKDN